MDEVGWVKWVGSWKKVEILIEYKVISSVSEPLRFKNEALVGYDRSIMHLPSLN